MFYKITFGNKLYVDIDFDEKTAEESQDLQKSGCGPV